MTTLANVRELAPRISELAPEFDKARRLPAELVNELVAAGAFRSHLAARYGGDELTPAEAIDVVQELSRADGSVGWTVAVLASGPILLAYVPGETFDEIYGTDRDALVCSAFPPYGQAHVIDGGYSYTGQWPFATGCLHASYFMANAVVFEDDDVRLGPVAGAPETRFCVVPAAEVEIIDTWHVAGLRGSASNDFRLDAVRVHETATGLLFGGAPVIRHPADRIPVMGRLCLGLAAVAVGIARGAVDDLMAIGRKKRPMRLLGRVAEDPVFRNRVGRLEATWAACRATLLAAATEAWERARSGEEASPADRVRLRSSISWVVEQSTAVVDGCFAASGTTGLFESSPLQRRLRDAHAVSQHYQLGTVAFTTAGAILLGEAVDLTTI